MFWLYVAFCILAFIVGVGTLAVAVLVWQRRTVRAARYLGLTLFALAEWSLTALIEAVVPDLATKIFWSKVLYLGDVLVPSLLLLFVLDYVSLGHRITRRLQVALAVEPCIVLLLTWSNELHGLIWPTVTAGPAGSFGAVYTHGPAYWFHIAYTFALIAIACGLLLWSAWRSIGAFRRQAIYVCLAICLGLPSGLLYMSLPNSLPGLDPTPVSFAAAGSLIAWILLRMRLFDLIPLAYESMFRHVDEGLMVLDRNDEIVAVNPAARELLVPIAQRGIIQSVSDLPAVMQERLRDGAGRSEILTLGSPARQLELRVYHLPGGGGQLAGRVVGLLDVTRLVDAETRLRVLNADLEHQVHERTADLSNREAVLRVANRALQEAGEHLRSERDAKSQFMTAVSHELRTPLTNITTYLSLLENGKPERHGYYLQTLKEQTWLLRQIVEQTLEVAAASGGAAPPVLAPLDVNQVATAGVAGFAETAAQKQVDLKLSVDGELPLALGSTALLSRALLTVLMNAICYTPTGGTVTLSTGVIAQSDTSWVTLKVADTGIGIDGGDLPHIFERRYRGRAAEETSSGVGLGLSTCQSVMSVQNGRVTVSSIPGHGSTFTLWLPQAATTQGEPVPSLTAAERA
jgi:signal transduction histidine kinase